MLWAFSMTSSAVTPLRSQPSCSSWLWFFVIHTVPSVDTGAQWWYKILSTVRKITFRNSSVNDVSNIKRAAKILTTVSAIPRRESPILIQNKTFPTVAAFWLAVLRNGDRQMSGIAWSYTVWSRHSLIRLEANSMSKSHCIRDILNATYRQRLRFCRFARWRDRCYVDFRTCKPRYMAQRMFFSCVFFDHHSRHFNLLWLHRINFSFRRYILAIFIFYTFSDLALFRPRDCSYFLFYFALWNFDVFVFYLGRSFDFGFLYWLMVVRFPFS